MSVDFYAFLGSDLENIESRCVEEFQHAGFDIQLHPDFKFLEQPKRGDCWIKIVSIPEYLERVTDTAYLVGFGYEISPHNHDDPKEPGWPPSKVKEWSYTVYTRTSSGRSTSAYYMQALTTAILAKITGGLLYNPEQGNVLTGKTMVSRLVKSIREIATQKEERMARIESLVSADANAYALANILMKQELEFDVGGYPFNGWPSTEDSGYQDPGNSIVSKKPQREFPKPKQLHGRKEQHPFYNPTIIGLTVIAFALFLMAIMTS